MLKDWWKYRNYLCATFYKHPNPPGKVICTLVWIINMPNLEKKWNLPIHVQAINSTSPSADVVLTTLTGFLYISLVCTCPVFDKKIKVCEYINIRFNPLFHVDYSIIFLRDNTIQVAATISCYYLWFPGTYNLKTEVRSLWSGQIVLIGQFFSCIFTLSCLGQLSPSHTLFGKYTMQLFVPQSPELALTKTYLLLLNGLEFNNLKSLITMFRVMMDTVNVLIQVIAGKIL